ncbi:hypothetical protein [Lacibacter sediminis]|uniref:Uncharacterized protein n=1 Tax=Lacibacter sediminis TaxID=2760713 RepID=A0A7G5XFQ3_9BACT|nr:hypothetical protein [Lacibacter sediminis]QNA44306.1 hypothetical protein H4075_19925 [Lacibacter sediminis]
MDLIKNNPYRTLGLLAGATAREQSRQITRLKQYLEAEQEPKDDFSFPVIGTFNRTLDSVNDASSKLNLDIDKMNAALFWFWNGNPITDEAAFDALKDGDTDTANQIWDRLIIEIKDDGKRFWKPVTEKNYSAFHNCFVLNTIKQNGNLQRGIIANLYFLESDLVQKFVSSVTDETYKTSKKDLQLAFLNHLYQDKGVPKNKLLEIVNKIKFSAKEDFLRQSIQLLSNPIEQKIEATKNKRKANKGNGAKAGQELFETTNNELAQLKATLGANDQKYILIADKLANEILQCSIEFFNFCQEKHESTNYFETAMKLAKIAEGIAVGNLAKERVADSIQTLEEMKDKEISDAITLLQSIKSAYESNKIKIEAQVRSMPLGFNQTINWDKVNHAIENSVDWDKAVNLIQEIIPQKNVDKIKNISNQTKISQYKNLVNFVMSKLTYLQKAKIRYISYWEAPGPAMPTAGDIEKIPGWIKWVAGIIIFLILLQTCD